MGRIILYGIGGAVLFFVCLVLYGATLPSETPVQKVERVCNEEYGAQGLDAVLRCKNVALMARIEEEEDRKMARAIDAAK